MPSAPTIRRPPFVNVPLQEGLRWRGDGGFVYQEKKDGVWCPREWRGSLLLGEQMRDGRYFAFDCLRINGQDIATAPLRARLAALADLAGRFDTSMAIVASGIGGEFLEAILAAGGEGVVAKELDAPYGVQWYKVKKQESHDLRVTEIDYARGSLHLADMNTGEDRGWCWCPSQPAFNALAVGDCVEVSCHSRHVSGKLREPKFSHRRPKKS